MNNNISVSVIVPVYNVEKYLKRCLDSLVNQTLQDIEIICINDGSTDNSAKILEEYAKKDSRIKILTQENAGQSVARNAGIKKASGEYIGFVDSDDWIDLDFYEKLYNATKKNDCDIATAGIIRLHKTHKKYHLKFDKEEITSDVNKKFELCDFPELSYVWNKIYKRENFNLKFEEGVFFEDVIFTPKILYNMDKLVTVPDTFYYYWRNSNSTVAKRTKKIKSDFIYARNKALQFIKDKNIDISTHNYKTYRFKIFGITVFKKRQKGDKIIYSLFNIFKLKIKT